MFGHQDDQSQQNDTTDSPDGALQAITDPVPNQTTSVPAPLDPPTVADPDTGATGETTTAPYLTDAPGWQHPGPPTEDGPAAPAAPAPPQSPVPQDMISPAGGFPKPLDYQAFSTDTTPPPAPALPAAPLSDDILDVSAGQLIEIKQQALEELSPLIDQLDQTPEEKFKTVMMLIQASDNQELVKKAYESAHAIKDEKARAQALLDIVNEINYFTTPHGS